MGWVLFVPYLCSLFYLCDSDRCHPRDVLAINTLPQNIVDLVSCYSNLLYNMTIKWQLPAIPLLVCCESSESEIRFNDLPRSIILELNISQVAEYCVGLYFDPNDTNGTYIP